jgi:galactose-1-phosphate uridylyltransferase
MSSQISLESLGQILQNDDISKISYNQLVELFENEVSQKVSISRNVQVDPRDGSKVIFNPARATRPHDNVHLESRPQTRECVICEGKTTGAIDYHSLRDGFTFINKNLFPMVNPTAAPESAHGLHFLQWTSSLHDVDWHNLKSADQVVVMQRLAALERSLLKSAGESMPEHSSWGGLPGHRGFVSIIKNGGRLVGGSLAHGHQQIAFTNIIPKRIEDDWRYEQQYGESFSKHLLRTSASDLIVADFGEAVLVVPYFMARPYNMVLIVRNASKRYLYELSIEEIGAVAKGWHLAIRSMYVLLPTLGREIAYNVVAHNGPGVGIYFEFLPFTQEMGGFEHLGLSICHANPRDAASRIREIIASFE